MQHGSQRLEGPLRGTTAWWRDSSDQPGFDLTAAGTPLNPPDEGNNRKKSNAGIRWDLVHRVRREIAAGDYDTPERWQAALDKLLDQLDAND